MPVLSFIGIILAVDKPHSLDLLEIVGSSVPYMLWYCSRATEKGSYPANC